MANRRMFSLDVVDTDLFLDLPASSQALYFHLGMRADDDGFVSSPRKIMKMVNCGSDDMNVLISRGFVIPFESGIIVLTHWRLNNYIQADRHKATVYQEELSGLTVINGVYGINAEVPCIQNMSILETPCIQDVSNLETQVSIGKDSISNISCSPDDERKQKSDILERQKKDFETIYQLYPLKKGKAQAFQYYLGYVGKGRTIDGTRYKLDKEQIRKAVMGFVEECERENRKLQYYPYFSSFMSKQILDYLPVEGGRDENGGTENRKPAADFYRRFLELGDSDVNEAD